MRVPTTSRTMSTRTTMATVVRLTPSRVRGRNSSVREGNAAEESDRGETERKMRPPFWG